MTRLETLGFSPARLARIDRFLKEQYIETGKLAGAILAIARRGEIVHQSVAGLADRERGVPMRDDTIFRLYSMTKPLTSIAFMMLVEEGLVTLNDPVHAFIPAWRDLGVFTSGVPGSFQTRRPANAMRIVDLLRHTSGLTYGFQMRSNVDAAYRHHDIGAVEGDVPLAQMIELLATLPLEFSPGDAWNYSVSTDVLGYLIGIISGIPFERYMRTRLLDPLGMHDTDFFVPETKQARLAACYAMNAAGESVLYDDPATSRFRTPPCFISGGGGLVGTAADYLRFCHMLLNGGAANGHRFLAPRSLKFMTMNHLPGGRELTELSRSMFSEAIYSGLGFGLGFAVVVDRAKTMMPGNVGEYFWGGVASTTFWIDSLDEIAVVLLTQLIPSSAWPIRQQLRALVYGAME
ncbi:MAG TPA: serine hydrolase domain-containing protein [Rhizomicrobium sp.]|jgi:CubicO group peptidase (beta-lactamase class C family)|nr:serine hydrolase domain-containing protein [Rhizomicrobium sp.]